MIIKARNRWQAFGVHLAFSFILFLVLSAIIKFFWYPGVLFEVDGGWNGIALIAGVDLVIGPLLTLMVYRVGKKGLKGDLALIFTLQVACVLAGMYVVQSVKPLYVVYSGDNYFVVSKDRFVSKGVSLDSLPMQDARKPVWVYVPPGENAEEVNDLWWKKGGADIDLEHYMPYLENISEVAQHGKEISDKPCCKEFQLVSRYGIYAVEVNVRTGEVEKVLRRLY